MVWLETYRTGTHAGREVRSNESGANVQPEQRTVLVRCEVVRLSHVMTKVVEPAAAGMTFDALAIRGKDTQPAKDWPVPVTRLRHPVARVSRHG
jgi:hypothetical protein